VFARLTVALQEKCQKMETGMSVLQTKVHRLEKEREDAIMKLGASTMFLLSV
jgi:hypothetical protein